MKKSYKVFSASLIVMIAVAAVHFSKPAGAQSNLFGSQSVYQFSDYLRYAETWVRNKEGAERRGIWKEDRFRFSGEAPEAEVMISETKEVDGETHKGIQFNTVQGKRRTLLFNEVPSGSKLAISYGVLSDRTEEEAVSYVNFRIWLGKNLIREVRVQNEKTWNEFQVSLGLYSFLNRAGNFRFEIFSDSPDPIMFSFDANIEA